MPEWIVLACLIIGAVWAAWWVLDRTEAADQRRRELEYRQRRRKGRDDA